MGHNPTSTCFRNLKTKHAISPIHPPTRTSKLVSLILFNLTFRIYLESLIKLCTYHIKIEFLELDLLSDEHLWKKMLFYLRKCDKKPTRSPLHTHLFMPTWTWVFISCQTCYQAQTPSFSSHCSLSLSAYKQTPITFSHFIHPCYII